MGGLKLRLGLDIGSVSLYLVVLDDNGQILKTIDIRHKGDPIGYAVNEITRTHNEFGSFTKCGFTGNGALQLAKTLEVPFINEFSAISAAVAKLSPASRTVFEMGGQQAKYIHLAAGLDGMATSLDDFAASGLCAAGTGSFLDQQATRIGIDIETEFGQMAVRSVNPPHIAGRCSVFAKSDMIHHQQRGVPVQDIIAGLCYAVARNFKGTIAKSKRLDKPVVFLGGVASNPGVVKAFRNIFELSESELIVPDWHKFPGAIGAAILSRDYQFDLNLFKEKCLEASKRAASDIPRTSPLTYSYPGSKNFEKTTREQQPRSEVKRGFLGIDIGSLSTNVVLIDEDCEVISRRYLMTAGRPIEAMQQGLREVREEIAADFEVLGAATTGSGRYLIGELVGADIIRNEITAQATGGSYFVPDADTIFEIGGQDSKYISLEKGVVVDFEMNRACAAGTGSFLEEQAERLDINIKKQFADLAFAAPNPVSAGERCTVFMESDLVRYEQGGASKEEITAGLALAVVHNYLNKVVGRKKVGNKILFQGGVAWNKAVVAAFETVVGKEIIVPPHHDITGAIGAAILVRNSRPEKSNFKGFDLALRKIAQETFLCEDCANMCNITRVVDSGRELYYGSRCEKYDAERSAKGNSSNAVVVRNRMFFASPGKSEKTRPLTVGLPRALSNWEYYYLWRRFFGELGIKVIISKASSGDIVKQGVESVGSETCFPVKVAHGHLIDLAKKKLDFIFLPAIVTGIENPPKGTSNFYCPYIQAFPFIAKASIKELQKIELVSPIMRFSEGPEAVTKILHSALGKFGLKEKEVKEALDKAMLSLSNLKAELIEKGKEYLSEVSAEKPGILLIGRPYNSLDPGVSMDIAKKLTDLGMTVIPMEMAPSAADNFGFIYWQSGRRILRAAKFARQTPNLYPVYISNFGCGPDSFILHHFKRIMGDKPHLILELDEHSADAGLVTRCEAFLDSLPKNDKVFQEQVAEPHSNGYKRKLLIPRMCDHADLFSAALRHCGLDAEVLAETDARSLELGRKHTGGRECYPLVLTTGDLLRELEKPGTDPSKIAFFMPTAGGPCRFGQYQQLHQQILENLGYCNVPVYSPSSDDSYSKFPETAKSFRRLAWRAFLVADYMRKFLLRTRPYENEIGKANKLYHQYMDEATRDIEQGGAHLPEIVYKSFRTNRAIIDQNISRKPRVGVIGEIYIRNNRYSNNNLVEKLESLGLEADISSFTEWIHFTTDEFKTESWRKRSLRGLVSATIKDFIQKRDERWVMSGIDDEIDEFLESPIKDILEFVEPYLPISVGGEAMPAMGKAIDMIKNGCTGIVNTLPFTCMPGNIINAISIKIARDFEDIPWLNMAYEGTAGENDLVRLGAFAESVKSWDKLHKANGNIVGASK
ncbi:MAG TPA: CoA activase [candidate division Zixibacteria bacterium]|nr:CoA activase [candidate division Zixibacteria bacterium]HBZ00966.1 CoA activase [candidate division Zixibacteria bacterium]